MKPARRLLAWFSVVLVCAPASFGCREQRQFGYDFERPETLEELGWTCRTLLRLSPDHATSGGTSLEVSFHPAPADVSDNYPGLSLSGFDPDWRGRRSLVFDAHNPGDSILNLTLRIDDREHPAYAERLNRPVPLQPGDHRISIALAGLATSGSGRPLDIRSIRRVSLFLANPAAQRRLYLDRIRLE